jgi:hypothetical protein
MDPKPRGGALIAHAQGGGALHFPSRDPHPSLDDHLVAPETRAERIRGRHVEAMPAHPPHADRQLELAYALRGSLKPGYVGATELLTRAGPGSDFATDVCVRKAGTDPATGTRYLEELAFEVVHEQSARDVREKAEDLTARGVRRVLAVFVKTGKVSLWSREKGAWLDLDPEGSLTDECLSRPIRIKALLDAAEADAAVAAALVEKQHPVIEAVKAETFREGQAAAVLAVLAARGVTLPEEARARIAACRDASLLERWLARAAVAGSVEDVLGPDRDV